MTPNQERTFLNKLRQPIHISYISKYILKTGVSINTHIDSRKTYVEGAGQLCAECFKETYNKVHKKDDNVGEKS